MTSQIVVDQIKPERILQKIGSYDMAFAESYKGEGAPSDANFQDFSTHWRREAPADVQEVWLEMFRRNVAQAATARGFNFCEFWGWPEVRVRDDLTCQVAARIRIIKLTLPHQPRIVE